MPGRCDHRLNSILFLVVAGVISVADGQADIKEFGNLREDWLANFVDFPGGIPSHDTIGRGLSIIKPEQFQVVLLNWLEELRSEHAADSQGDRDDSLPKRPVHVAIDGKTARRSHTDAGKTDALHIVSAWASENGLTLGQVAVGNKTNEITAIPDLLEKMDLRRKRKAVGCDTSFLEKLRFTAQVWCDRRGQIGDLG